MIQKLFAELLGTTLLLLAVVGSGHMGEMISGGSVGLALLINALTTGCTLFLIITIVGHISGAHFNPAVTLFFALRDEFSWKITPLYFGAQIAGAFLGVWLAHLFFELPILQLAEETRRTGYGMWAAEFVSTFGLMAVILGGLRAKPEAVPMLVALYITAGYFFASSSAFANPAVTFSRGFTDTFTGINLAHVPMFVLMQVAGVIVAYLTLPYLFPRSALGANEGQ